MKYIKTFEGYSKSDIEEMVKITTQKGDMRLDVSIDDFIRNGKPEIGSFESFVKGGFVSRAVLTDRLEDFLTKFEKLGLDISKVKSLKKYPDLIDDLENKIHDMNYDLSMMEDDEEKSHIEKEIDRSTDLLSDYYEKTNNLKEELVKLASDAKGIIYSSK